MKKQFQRKGPLLRWGRVLLMSAPLLLSCEKSSKAESAPTPEPAAEGTLVAASAPGKDKGTQDKADMKEVILHVFGMT